MQPVAPAHVDPNISALVDALQPMQTRFRQQASPMTVDLESKSFSSSVVSVQTRISSVGLGYRTITWWHLVFNLVNSAAAAQSISLSPLFPFNCISRTTVQINGGAMVYNASGVGGFLAAARKNRNALRFDTTGGFGPALSPAYVQVQVGTNGTATNATKPSLSGIASISVAASSTCVLTVDMWTQEKFALDRDSLIGALPLQNSATFAQLTYTLQPAFTGGATASSFPFYNAGANTTATLQNTSTVQSSYDFWSVPSDPALYADMIGNSYQIQEDSGNPAASNAADGLIYNIPRNMYLVAAHLLAVDGNSALLPVQAAEGSTSIISPLRLQYNAGTVRVVQMEYGRWRNRQFVDYGADRAIIPGYYLWDGEATSESQSQTDNAGWLDAYNAANPQIIGTLGSGIALPATFSLIREQIVAGAVSVV